MLHHYDPPRLRRVPPDRGDGRPVATSVSTARGQGGNVFTKNLCFIFNCHSNSKLKNLWKTLSMVKLTGTVLCLTAVVFLCLHIQPAESCNVPVFRFALERWHADIFEVVVFHRGEMSPDEKVIVEKLEKASTDQNSYSNYTVRIVDLKSEVPKEMLNLWNSLDSPEAPWFVVRYPESARIWRPFWSSRLTSDAVNYLADSPVRSKIAERILDGESVVWVFIESGDTEQDNSAAEMLKSQLSNLESTLKLPETVDWTDDGTASFTSNGQGLRIAFSLIRVSRDDPRETMLIQMLMHSEPDLFDYISYPMAFPVYGRGRALYALIGDGINERNIHLACTFVTGACSCEIKAINPGIDLLMTVDWDAGIQESWIQYTELAPLVGLSQLATAANAADSSSAADSDASGEAETDKNTVDSAHKPDKDTGNAHVQNRQSESAHAATHDSVVETGLSESSNHLFRNILFALVVIGAVIVILSLKIGTIKTGNRR